MDFEVHEVTSVIGSGTEADSDQEFLPFYAANDLTQHLNHRAYFALHRVPRVLSSKQRRSGPRSSYIGSETNISLVDSAQAPYRSDLKQLALEILCTNRDLPMTIPIGKGDTDFTLPLGGPIKSVHCVAGPTQPQPQFAEGEAAWRLISHLSLNYLSLGDSDDSQGAAGLRELLSLYAGSGDTFTRRQVEGIRSVRAEPIIRRVPGGGPTAVARGLEVTITLDEAAFEGTGEFLIGAVLEQFFTKYVSINAFTETVVKTLDRGEVMRWPTRIGRRHQL